MEWEGGVARKGRDNMNHKFNEYDVQIIQLINNI